MRRVFWIGAASLVGLACRSYDFYSPIASERGLVSAAQYSRYGTEQSQRMAIARSLGQWHGGSSAEARATMVTKAAEFARGLPAVAGVVADTQGYRLTVTFKSGWRTFVLPVNDGVKP